MVDVPGLGKLFAWGPTVPADEATGYAKGCIFQHTDAAGGGTLFYVNTGSTTSANFDAMLVQSAATFTDNVTLQGNLTVQGDATFEDDLTLVDKAITNPAFAGTASGTGVSATERGAGTIHRTILTLTGVVIDTTDAGANGGHGTLPIYTFPTGYIKILGCMLWIDTITAGAGGIDDAGVIDIGLGSAAVGVDNEELATTEQDIGNKVDLTLVAGTKSNVGSYNYTDLALDGTSTAIIANLNAAVTAATHGAAADTLTITGRINIDWVNIGEPQ